jgi:1-acyl-sn-glycerol-3-phosphate acyltransferase
MTTSPQFRQPWEPLYDAVATGMRIYSDCAFRVVVLGRERLHAPRHVLLVSTHRSDADVPIICGRLYFADRMYLRRGPRLHFAARDDLFESGALGGLLPAQAPLWLRRVLYGFDPAPYMPRVRVNPIRSAVAMRAVQALRFAPDAPLARSLPNPLVAEILRRAQAAGLPVPATAADADRPELAGVIWTEIERDQLPDARGLWQARAQAATGDLRRLIDLHARGEPLLLFPEGTPSPHGAIGPLRRGLGLIVRRSRPRAILPLAVAYDPLTAGRPFAFLTVGEPFPPPRRDVEEAVLDVLRRTVPLTCAQVVAHRLLVADGLEADTLTPAELDRWLAAAVEGAHEDGRAVDPSLRSPSTRRKRLSDCLLALARGGLVEVPEANVLVLNRERIRADHAVRRAAFEFASSQIERDEALAIRDT